MEQSASRCGLAVIFTILQEAVLVLAVYSTEPETDISKQLGIRWDERWKTFLVRG